MTMRIRLGVARPRDALPLLALQREVLAEGRWFVTDGHHPGFMLKDS